MKKLKKSLVNLSMLENVETAIGPASNEVLTAQIKCLSEACVHGFLHAVVLVCWRALIKDLPISGAGRSLLLSVADNQVSRRFLRFFLLEAQFDLLNQLQPFLGSVGTNLASQPLSLPRAGYGS